jgi:hypothetical protein
MYAATAYGVAGVTGFVALAGLGGAGLAAVAFTTSVNEATTTAPNDTIVRDEVADLQALRTAFGVLLPVGIGAVVAGVASGTAGFVLGNFTDWDGLRERGAE